RSTEPRTNRPVDRSLTRRLKHRAVPAEISCTPQLSPARSTQVARVSGNQHKGLRRGVERVELFVPLVNGWSTGTVRCHDNHGAVRSFRGPATPASLTELPFLGIERLAELQRFSQSCRHAALQVDEHQLVVLADDDVVAAPGPSAGIIEG